MIEKKEITIHQIIWYLVIFSIIGLIIETLFCLITTGVLESRKGLIYGPFCPIYGVGATILIVLLDKFKNSNIKLFVFGGILGSLIEYIISFGLEAFYGTRFWDYSYLKFNLNGRICITYTLFWGILAIVLIKLAKPCIDYIINKISIKKTKIVDILIILAAILDIGFTIWGINSYKNRAICHYYKKNTDNVSITKQIENKIFSD